MNWRKRLTKKTGLCYTALLRLKQSRIRNEAQWATWRQSTVIFKLLTRYEKHNLHIFSLKRLHQTFLSSLLYVTQFYRSARKIGGRARGKKTQKRQRRNVKCAAREALTHSKIGKQSRGLFLHHCHYPVSNNSETISLSLMFFSWKARLCGVH